MQFGWDTLGEKKKQEWWFFSLAFKHILQGEKVRKTYLELSYFLKKMNILSSKFAHFYLFFLLCNKLSYIFFSFCNHRGFIH